MATLRLGFNISHRQSQGKFRGNRCQIICDDNEAMLIVEKTTYKITHCQLDKLGDLGSQWDEKKEAFFQINMDDGRKLVAYTSRLQEFRSLMTQWRLMKKNIKAEMQETAKTERANKKTNVNTTVEISKALQELKKLYDLDIISQEEYEAKRQELVAQL